MTVPIPVTNVVYCIYKCVMLSIVYISVLWGLNPPPLGSPPGTHKDWVYLLNHTNTACVDRSREFQMECMLTSLVLTHSVSNYWTTRTEIPTTGDVEEDW